jgi:hypothetical protein
MLFSQGKFMELELFVVSNCSTARCGVDYSFILRDPTIIFAINRLSQSCFIDWYPHKIILYLIYNVFNCKSIALFHVIFGHSRFIRHFTLCILLYEVSQSRIGSQKSEENCEKLLLQNSLSNFLTVALFMDLILILSLCILVFKCWSSWKSFSQPTAFSHARQ